MANEVVAPGSHRLAGFGDLNTIGGWSTHTVSKFDSWNTIGSPDHHILDSQTSGLLSRTTIQPRTLHLSSMMAGVVYRQ